jgi:ligand-binding SRPBCC domain-containing protein
MTPHVLERKQTVDRPLEEVFSFFQAPENLARITPPRLGFRILAPEPVRMKEGAVIDYVIRLFGVPVHWRTLITKYDPPRCFVDEQIKGPYAFWHHTHAFRDLGSATEMTDTVRYLLPLGPVGRVGHALLVRRQLDGIFDYRARIIADLFETRDILENRG